MVECKFRRKQIDMAGLDSYIMLYHNAKQTLGLNGLLFVCPSAGVSEYAKSNHLIKYPNENIRNVDSRNRWKEFEEN